MDAQQVASNSTRGINYFTIFFVLAGAVAIYYLYTALYGSASTATTMLVSDVKPAAPISSSQLPSIPTPYEGGDYSVNFWIYINSFNKNRNKRKHIFELKGEYFSTLLVGLGAFKNNLIVRTHSAEISSTLGGAGGASGASGAASVSLTPESVSDMSRTDGSLSASDVSDMFKVNMMEDSTSMAPPVCDLAEVGMQKWVMVTVVLSGRMIDVYMDGKLVRSCVSKSYFKVDPTGVKPVICDNDGFDGHISGVSVSNYGLNPEQIYRLYLSGPKGSTWDVFKWLGSLFTGNAAPSS